MSFEARVVIYSSTSVFISIPKWNLLLNIIVRSHTIDQKNYDQKNGQNHQTCTLFCPLFSVDCVAVLPFAYFYTLLECQNSIT